MPISGSGRELYFQKLSPPGPGPGCKHYVDITLVKRIIPPTHSQSMNPFFVAIQSKYLEADAIQKTFNTDHSWTDVNTELQRRRCGY